MAYVGSECHIILCFLFFGNVHFSTGRGAQHASEVDECVLKCPFQNPTDDAHFDSGCGSECIEQCNHGCSLWRRALETSCQAACNVTTEVLPPRELYCVMGCNEALNQYYQQLKERIGTPAAPALVADSLTATSLSLEWEGSRHSNLSYLVQWRYEELAGAWQYCRNQTWGQHSIVRVENLQPYTKYRFRVAVLLSARHNDPIVSAPSVVISTLPSGPPTSAPIELRVTAVDAFRVSLSWEPGPFPNGPILSYVLRISETDSTGYVVLKDLPASENNLFYMFQSLSPSVTYEVSVAMRNGEGEGPQAIVHVTTPAMPQVVSSQVATLILGGSHLVLQATDILDDPTVLYNSTSSIQGIGIDINRRLLFVSDSSGTVYRKSLSPNSPSTAILGSSVLTYGTLDLSVDWLNAHLYILQEVNHNAGRDERNATSKPPHWQVVRCGYDGRGQTIAFAGYQSKPVHIEVDPYNGYLFWALQGASTGGLYRLDLADISNGVKHEVTPYRVLKEAHLGAFTVDHTNFRILIPHLTKNTVLSVSLDGREVSDFRMHIQSPSFRSVESLAYANGLFYWTNGMKVLQEEYNTRQKSYFHNEYPDLIDSSFSTVLVNLPSCQPTPVAVNPPIGLQSVMGAHHAKISWQAPHLLGHQGNGAWQSWHYHLQITDAQHNTTMHRSDINSTTSYIARNLKENTTYIIKAAAVTSSGTGPWSSEFTAKTLSAPKNGLPSSMLWSSHEGLLRSDLTGDGVRTLVHPSYLRGAFVTDISWYRDHLYLVTNASAVMWYNLTSQEKGWMRDMDNVGSLAVDWIGGKLYWSSPKQQLITRGNLRGSSREPVPIITVGKELKIDAQEGYLYWNTGHAIESARLNGEQKLTYYPAQLFRKQVMGLTVDLQGKLVYWIVHGYEGSNLYKAPTADMLTPGSEISGTLISSLPGASTLGPLCYFSDRLIWLQDDAHAVISDLTGHNKANLNDITKTYVNTIAVIDPNIQGSPEAGGKVNVIPESVNQSSIMISGDWDMFNISWSPITKVNYGTVFYEIKVEYNHKINTEYTTTEPYVTYKGGQVFPYSIIDLSVRAFTYWGAAPITTATLKSPQAPPTNPTNPRVFIQHQGSLLRNENEVSAVFRWDKPLHSNGQIRGFRVTCWYREDDLESPACHNVILSHQEYEYYLPNVLKNVTYYFRVEAFTDAGHGPMSPTVSALTDLESPIPRLAMAFQDSIKVVDLDLGTGHIVSRSTGRPLDFAVSMREGNIYWINEMQEIFVSRMDETGYVKLTSINGTAISIAVDWVTRLLYWSQNENHPDQFACVVYSLDLSEYEVGKAVRVSRVLGRDAQIQRLQVAPLSRSLYWVETQRIGQGKIFTANMDGSNIQPFFTSKHFTAHEDADEDCNCPEDPEVRSSFTLDLENPNKPVMYWVDFWLNHITMSDMRGCQCQVVVNATQFYNEGFPPDFITVDSQHVYWSNISQREMYSAPKTPQHTETVKKINVTSNYKILVLGNRIQPYPPRDCLFPKQTPLQVSLRNRTSTSLSIILPKPAVQESCEKYSTARARYTVLYQAQADGEPALPCDAAACTTERTFDNVLHLGGLRPFSKYAFSLEVNNYYGELKDIRPVVGDPVVFRTSAGAPLPVQDVHLQVLSPHHARVHWSLPLPPHTSSLAAVDANIGAEYEVHWRTEGKISYNREHNTVIEKSLNVSHYNTCQADLLKLMPGQSYTVWVRARSAYGDDYMDSAAVSMQTYAEPSDIQATFIAPYVLHVAWLQYQKIQIISHIIEYTELSSDLWKQVENEGFEKPDGYINYVVQNLRPKTQYKFRLQLSYANNSTPYIWPQETAFIFETLADKPSPPGKPVVEQLSGSVYQLHWQPSSPNGSPVQMYRVYGLARPSDPAHKLRMHRNARQTLHSNLLNDTGYSSLLEVPKEVNYSLPQADLPHLSDSMLLDSREEEEQDGWEMLYNGTDNYWIITRIRSSECYTFHVQACNSLGWSALSEASEEFDFSRASVLAVKQDYYRVFQAIGGSVFVTLMAVTTCICLVKRRDKKSSISQSFPIQATLRGPDVELATLRELPRSRGGGGALFQHSTNILYNAEQCGPPTDADIALLPHIMRDQITLSKFLGSGAFGEVFEGKAKNLEFQGSEMRVAVKTLRKGATDQEKTEFLQEAKLMSNFKHEHILRMVGVCLDNDPNFIIMELMEGGDLLSYLRARRPMLYCNDSLTLRDLLSMCLDVTRGCRYLEELHFVHRDLACRNCLVSHQPQGRIVKIGDFGLARDIYKNDYYRKEGEGLLPVRWMAVECLTDGVFTRASDVWAWAVLCWEVGALGRQPYPALPNHAVMRYVRSGGTLPRPHNCPPAFFKLLQRCWSYNPEQRPTFKQCLEVLEELVGGLSQDTLITDGVEHEPSYITVVPDVPGVSNPAYFVDENHNKNNITGDMETTSFSDSPEGEVQDPAQAAVDAPPKYLQLIYDDEEPVVCRDGYEVPITSLRNCNSFRSTPQRNSFTTFQNKRLNRLSDASVGSTAQDKPIRATMIETNCVNGTVLDGRLSEQLRNDSENEPNSLQKLIAGDRHSLRGISRNNSMQSHVSDDEKMTQTGREGKRLLNHHTGSLRLGASTSSFSGPCNLTNQK